VLYKYIKRRDIIILINIRSITNKRFA
jgi:hypothetical protein